MSARNSVSLALGHKTAPATPKLAPTDQGAETGGSDADCVAVHYQRFECLARREATYPCRAGDGKRDAPPDLHPPPTVVAQAGGVSASDLGGHEADDRFRLHIHVATELNRREIEAPRGGCWYPTGVARLRQRLAA